MVFYSIDYYENWTNLQKVPKHGVIDMKFGVEGAKKSHVCMYAIKSRYLTVKEFTSLYIQVPYLLVTIMDDGKWI
jgi:hypothetical protein